jgi:heme exporter protein D
MIDLDMSPYGAFVWPAWAISAAVLAGLAARALLAARRWSAELKRLEAEAEPGPGASRRAEGPAR